MEVLPKFFASIAGMLGTIWCTWTSWVLLVGGGIPLMDVPVEGSLLASLAFFAVVEPIVIVVMFFGTYYLVTFVAVTLLAPIVVMGKASSREPRRTRGAELSSAMSLSETEDELERRLRREQKQSSSDAEANGLRVGEFAHFENGIVRFRESVWRRGLGTVSSLRAISEEDVDKEWFLFDYATLPPRAETDHTVKTGEVRLDAEDVRKFVRRSPERQSDLAQLFSELCDLRSRIAETGATRTWGGWTVDEDS